MKSCATMNTAAPTSAPYRRPVPPSTSMIRSSAERGNPSESRPTNWVVWASSAPATPAMAAPTVKAARRRRSTLAPIAGMRLPPSRMPRSDMPNGEFTTRRSSTNSRNSTPRLYQNAVLPYRSNSKAPNSGAVAMPDRPSTPPVMKAALLAASNSIRPMPRVTIKRARSWPRTTRKLTTKPDAPATSAAASRPDTGSPQPCTDSRPAV